MTERVLVVSVPNDAEWQKVLAWFDLCDEVECSAREVPARPKHEALRKVVNTVEYSAVRLDAMAASYHADGYKTLAAAARDAAQEHRDLAVKLRALEDLLTGCPDDALETAAQLCETEALEDEMEAARTGGPGCEKHERLMEQAKNWRAKAARLRAMAAGPTEDEWVDAILDAISEIRIDCDSYEVVRLAKERARELARERSET